jgi:hypothetical protein
MLQQLPKRFPCRTTRRGELPVKFHSCYGVVSYIRTAYPYEVHLLCFPLLGWLAKSGVTSVTARLPCVHFRQSWFSGRYVPLHPVLWLIHGGVTSSLSLERGKKREKQVSLQPRLHPSFLRPAFGAFAFSLSCLLFPACSFLLALSCLPFLACLTAGDPQVASPAPYHN